MLSENVVAESFFFIWDIFFDFGALGGRFRHKGLPRGGRVGKTTREAKKINTERKRRRKKTRKSSVNDDAAIDKH